MSTFETLVKVYNNVKYRDEVIAIEKDFNDDR